MNLWTTQFWLIAGSLLAVAALLAVIGARAWRQRRRERIVDDSLAAVATDRLRDVVVPDGTGGEIELAHVLLTVSGVLVVDVKRIEGRIFGSDRMDDWTAMAEQRRLSFPNPQGPLLDRVAAVRRLLHDVPVDGRVVFVGDARFGDHPPSHVLRLDALQAWAGADGGQGTPPEPYLVAWRELRRLGGGSTTSGRRR